jgi:hypothetical protein
MIRARGSILTLSAAAALATALLAPPAGLGAARAKDDYKAYASCADAKPFPAARRCGYDRREAFRGTFVFRSKVGKRNVKACFQIYGRAPVGGGHACYKLGRIAYKAYPFKVTGVRQPFSVKVKWFVKEPGDGFEPVATSFLRVHT